MRIKPKPKITRKQKAYLKWMGMVKPKSKGRLAQLNKHNRKSLHKPSELVAIAQSEDYEGRNLFL